MNTELPPWALDCLDQLRQEEEALAAVLASVRLVGKALTANESAALENALEAQAKAIATVDKVRNNGQHLRNRLDAQGDLNSAMLIRHLPPDQGEAVSHRVRRLRENAVLLDRDNRRNAYVVHQCLRFVHRLLGVLLGVSDVSDRYSATGAPKPSGYGSLLSAKG
jgi:hypothetical protein